MPPLIGGWVMQVVWVMSHHHLPLIRFWWTKGRWDFGRGLRTFAGRRLCFRGGERTSLCLDREGRVGLRALWFRHLDRTRGRALSGATGGNGAPNPCSGILPETKSVPRDQMCGRARRAWCSEPAAQSTTKGWGQRHARRA